jgi:tRNA U34 2-thiouridine synthase MnmA/TrmU
MKALSVFSGGLDSILAAEIIRRQGIEVQAVFFETPFFTSAKAKATADAVNLPIKIINITGRHIEVVKDPPHGYGGNMNPCIDCHALMFRIAGEMMQEEGASFIITGEVLGQRPMSQNRGALSIIDRQSGIEGLILRPLSAKHLSVTIPEEKGWIKRDEMMDFSGRSRKPQLELAGRFNITNYPSPAGGCLLTEEVFSRRLRDLMSSNPEFEVRDIELLKIGRHFRIGPKTKLIIGRKEDENDIIESSLREDDLLITTPSVPGPSALLTGEITHLTEGLAAVMTVSYSDAKTGETLVKLMRRGRDILIMARGQEKEGFIKYMI